MFGPAYLNAQFATLGLGGICALLSFVVLLTPLPRVCGWDEENLLFHVPHVRSDQLGTIRVLASQTRVTNLDYWLHHDYLPAVLK